MCRLFASGEASLIYITTIDRLVERANLSLDMCICINPSIAGWAKKCPFPVLTADNEKVRLYPHNAGTKVDKTQFLKKSVNILK